MGVQKLKGELTRVRKRRVEVQRRETATAAQYLLTLYKEYLSGIIADRSINTAELTHMERHKKQRKGGAEDHAQILKQLGMSAKEFDALKSFEDVTTNEDECVVCYEPPKDHMIMPCMHVVLCPECAEENFPAPHDGQKCPLCSKDIVDVKQVRYF